MIDLKVTYREYIYPKLKFGLSSATSTGLDYLIFYSLLDTALAITLIQAIAQVSGMLCNFILQRSFIFEKNRSLQSSFTWSISFSVLAIILASSLVTYLYTFKFFQEYPLIMKVSVTVLFFFFNFYTKQYAFEKKFKW